MVNKQPFKILSLLMLTAALALSGCGPLTQIVTKSGVAPTPVVSVQQGGVENPDVYVDSAEFQNALLLALAARDSRMLQMWMSEPFLTGTWRADLSETDPGEALKAIYVEQTAEDIQITLVKDADLKGLMGGVDPLSIPGEPGVVDAILISGWGKNGLDEVVLFVSRQPDNSLKWRGWMLVQGGFSGARLGGNMLYQNANHGYSLYLPKDYQVTEQTADDVAIVAPQVEGAGHPGVTFINVEPANGRTSQQAAEQAYQEAKEAMGEGSKIYMGEAMNIDSAEAYVVHFLPGQDLNRQLFMVQNDWLFRITFAPEDPQSGFSYRQMESAYAMIVNTFHFTQ